MTPEQLRALAQPVAEIYGELTDELMEKIAVQLASRGDFTPTAQWQMQKLAQTGALNAETVKTIARYTAVCPELTEQIVSAAAMDAIAAMEPQLQQAAAAGLLGAAPPALASERLMRTLKAYQKQAIDTYNLVNTVMAYKVRDAYTGIVNKVADRENRAEYLSILGKNTASVVTGQQARMAALRQCIKEFSEKGLPGFVDKAGREWSPEAYVNMDIRTTVNNVAHQAQFDRMDDYGADFIMVSSHVGARPRCEPFQGKLYSRSGKSGYAEDLNGGRIPYAPWGSTSYGEAAGLLGINCGHQVYPFFPEFSRMSHKPYPKEQNDKAYAESQRQRRLERQVRASKRECAMLDKLGDKEGFDLAALRLKDRERALKDFTAATGRRFKSDRVQTPGFGRSISEKAQLAYQRNQFDLKFLDEYGAKHARELLHRAENAVGVLPKLEFYALNPQHSTGRNKALVFESALGYNLSNAKELEAQIRSGLKRYKAVFKGSGIHGDKYEVRMLIKGPKGIQPVVTGWIFDPGEIDPRMVSAYVVDKRHQRI